MAKKKNEDVLETGFDEQEEKSVEESLDDETELNEFNYDKNRKFTTYEKETIINRVLLNNESLLSVAIDEDIKNLKIILMMSVISEEFR